MQVSSIPRINSGSLHPPRGGGRERDNLDPFEGAREPSPDIHAGDGIAMGADPRQMTKRTNHDDGTSRYFFGFSKFDEHVGI